MFIIFPALYHHHGHHHFNSCMPVCDPFPFNGLRSGGEWTFNTVYIYIQTIQIIRLTVILGLYKIND